MGNISKERSTAITRVRIFGPSLDDVARFLSRVRGDDGERPICWDEGVDVVVKCVGGHVVSALCEFFGDSVYSIDGRAMEEVVAALMTAGAYSVATAESCTGGLAGQLLTSVPGSSKFYAGGFITYSNRSKTDLLSVPEDVIDSFGAVSEQVAGLMASGARARLGSDVAVAVSGIAGPDGGTEAKPVGTVCFGLASADAVSTVTVNFKGGRDAIRTASATYALDLLRRWVSGGDVPGSVSSPAVDIAGRDCMN